MIRSIAWGIIIMAIGAWIWVSKVNPDVLHGPTFRRDWPLVIVACGLMTVGEGIAWSVRRQR